MTDRDRQRYEAWKNDREAMLSEHERTRAHRRSRMKKNRRKNLK